jgi:NAD(P)-dependent dehydrogenase (short-subunit alcohol dehydrogenase family)
MDRLDGTIALVAGTGRLGITTALHLSKAGATVVLAGIDNSRNHELQQIIRVTEGLTQFIQTDLCNQQDVLWMITMIVNQYGRLDYAFNDLASMNILLDNKLETSLKRSLFQGICVCLHYELQQMLKQHHGVIVSSYCTPEELQYHNMVHVYSDSRDSVKGASIRLLQSVSNPTNSFRQLFNHQEVDHEVPPKKHIAS